MDKNETLIRAVNDVMGKEEVQTTPDESNIVQSSNQNINNVNVPINITIDIKDILKDCHSSACKCDNIMGSPNKDILEKIKEDMLKPDNNSDDIIDEIKQYSKKIDEWMLNNSNENTELISENKILKEKIEELKKSNSTIVSDFKEQLKNLKDELDTARSTSSIKERYEQIQKENEEEISALKKKIEDLESVENIDPQTIQELEEKTKDLGELQIQLEETKEKLRQTELLLKIEKQVKDGIENMVQEKDLDLESVKERLQKTYKSLETIQKEKESILNAIKKRNQINFIQTQEFKEKLKSADLSIKEKDEIIANMKKEQDSLDAEMVNLREATEKIQALQQKVDNLQTDITQKEVLFDNTIEIQKQEHKNRISEIESNYQKELDEIKSTANIGESKFNEKLARSKLEVRRLEKFLDRANKKLIDDLSSKDDENLNLILRLQEEYAESKKKYEEEITRLSESQKFSDENIGLQKIAIDEYIQEIKKANEDVQSVSTQNSILEAEVEAQKVSIKDLRTKIDEINSSNLEYETKIQEAQDEIIKSKNEIESLLEKRDRQILENQTLLDQIKKGLDKAIEDKEENYRDSQEKYVQLQNNIDEIKKAASDKEMKLKEIISVNELEIEKLRKDSERKDALLDEIKTQGEKEIDELKKSHQEKIKSLEEERENIIKNIKESDQTNLEFITKTNSDTINSINIKHDKEIKEKEEEIESLMGDLTGKYNKEIEQLNEKHESDLKIEKERYEKSVGQIQTLEDQKKQLENDLERSRELQIELKNKINNNQTSTDSNISELEQKLEASNNDIEDLQMQIRDLESEMEKDRKTYENQLKSVTDSGIKVIGEKDETITELKTELGSVQTTLASTLEELLRAGQKIQENESNRMEMENLLTNIRSELESKNEILSRAEQNVNQELSSKAVLDLQKKDLENKLMIASNKEQQLLEQYQILSRQFNEAKDRIVQLSKEIEVLKSQFFSVQQQKDQEIQGFESQINMLQNSLVQQIEFLRQQKDQEIEVLKEQNKQEIEQKDQEIKNIEVEVEQKINTLTQQKEQEIESLKLQIQNIESGYESFSNQIDELNSTIRNIKDQLTSKDSIIEQKVQEINELKNNLGELGEKSKDEISNLELEIIRLKSAESTLDFIKNQAEKLEITNIQLKGERDEILKKYDDLTTKISQEFSNVDKNDDVSAFVSIIGQIASNIQGLREMVVDQQEELSSDIQNINENLREQTEKANKMENDLNRIASIFNIETDSESTDKIVNRISELQQFYRTVHDLVLGDKLPLNFDYSNLDTVNIYGQIENQVQAFNGFINIQKILSGLGVEVNNIPEVEAIVKQTVEVDDENVSLKREIEQFLNEVGEDNFNDISLKVKEMKDQIERITELNNEKTRLLDENMETLEKLRGEKLDLAAEKKQVLKEAKEALSRDDINEMTDITEQLRKIDSKLVEGEGKILRLEEEISSLKAQISTMEEENESLSEDLSKMEIENEKLSQDAEKDQAKIQSLILEGQKLEEKLRNMDIFGNLSPEDKTQIESMINESQSKLSELKESIKKYENTLLTDSEKGDRVELLQQIVELEEKINILKNRLSSNDVIPKLQDLMDRMNISSNDTDFFSRLGLLYEKINSLVDDSGEFLGIIGASYTEFTRYYYWTLAYFFAKGNNLRQLLFNMKTNGTDKIRVFTMSNQNSYEMTLEEVMRQFKDTLLTYNRIQNMQTQGRMSSVTPETIRIKIKAIGVPTPKSLSWEPLQISENPSSEPKPTNPEPILPTQQGKRKRDEVQTSNKLSKLDKKSILSWYNKDISINVYVDSLLNDNITDGMLADFFKFFNTGPTGYRRTSKLFEKNNVLTNKIVVQRTEDGNDMFKFKLYDDEGRIVKNDAVNIVEQRNEKPPFVVTSTTSVRSPRNNTTGGINQAPHVKFGIIGLKWSNVDIDDTNVKIEYLRVINEILETATGVQTRSSPIFEKSYERLFTDEIGGFNIAAHERLVKLIIYLNGMYSLTNRNKIVQVRHPFVTPELIVGSSALPEFSSLFSWLN